MKESHDSTSYESEALTSVRSRTPKVGFAFLGVSGRPQQFEVARPPLQKLWKVWKLSPPSQQFEVANSKQQTYPSEFGRVGSV